jgi:hypothetical protein
MWWLALLGLAFAAVCLLVLWSAADDWRRNESYKAPAGDGERDE